MLVLLLACSQPAPSASSSPPTPVATPTPATRPPRSEWQHPAALLEAIGVGAGAQVAILGDGSGFMNPHLLKAVGPTGSVTALHTKRTTEMCAGSTPLKCARTQPDAPAVPSDTQFLVLVDGLRFLDDRTPWMCAAALAAPQAKVAVVELKRGLREPWAPPRSELINKGDVRKTMKKCGLTEIGSFSGLPFQHALFFERRPVP